jgi:hypothetical protein
MEREVLVGVDKPGSVNRFNLQQIYSNKKSKALWLFGYISLYFLFFWILDRLIIN